MEQLLEKAKAFLKARKRRILWYRALNIMAAIVIFVTTYMLILPAITMERPTICGKEEHTHTEECFEQRETQTVRELQCTVTSSNPIIHTHDANCYDQNGNLVCRLPEVKEHIHSQECYRTGKNLICGQSTEPTEPQNVGDLFGDGADFTSEIHVHTEECYEESTALICTLPEITAHTHTEACYDEAGSLICTQPEVIAHQPMSVS